MNILRVIITSIDGRMRFLELRPGSLNILTGQSGTGKSSIAEIIDYCFGSKECDVSVGPLRSKVAWYGLLLKVGDGQALIARECPPVPQKASESCFVATGRDLGSIQAADIRGTTNVAGLRNFLSETLGLGEYQGEVKEGRSKAPTAVSFRHALALCLQTQSEIAQKKVLLHGAADNWVAQALKDTLPYFLGATSRDDVEGRQRLREFKAQLRKMNSLLEAAAASDGHLSDGTRAMLEEARAVGLRADALPADEETAALLLREIAEAGVPLDEPIEGAEQAEHEIDRLFGSKARMLDERARLQDEIALLDAFSSTVGGYGVELEQQVSRLRSLGLVEKDAGSQQKCALCAAPLMGPSANDSARELHELLSALESRFVNSTAGAPRVREERVRLAEEVERIEHDLTTLVATMSQIRDNEAQVAHLRDGIARQALVLGRISKFLEGYSPAESAIPDAGQLSKLEAQVRLLEKRVSDDALRERLDSALSRVGRKLTAYAQQLKLEHSQDPVRFDLAQLQVVVDTALGPVSMRNMGSGENWIGYHIAAHLALHDRFLAESSPVPRFLVLDQPSQVYFPEADPMATTQDVDLEAVERLYGLLKDFVDEHEGHFQIIVTDHANLKLVGWFQDAIVEVWRGGDAFVPDDWPSVLAKSA